MSTKKILRGGEVRNKLAYAYKILSHLGLDDHTYTHLSARLPGTDSFIIYPFGMRFEEVEPEVLLEVSYNGQVIYGEEYQYNKTGYVIHGNIYEARKDINAIFHIHNPYIVAVSACEKGLMSISQWALHFYGRVAYHKYDSLALSQKQGADLVKDMKNKFTVLMRNHGSLTCGRTIEEAMFYTYHLYQACKTQCIALSMMEELVIPARDVCEQSVVDLLSFEKNLGERDWKAWSRLIDRHGKMNV